MYIFGRESQTFNVDEVIKLAKTCEYDVYTTDIDDFISILDKTRVLWRVGGKYYQEAFSLLVKDGEMSVESITLALDSLYQLLSKDELYKRLEGDFGKTKALDCLEYRHATLSQRFAPLGVLLHVTAGNVFLGAIDSFIMGVLTKNVNIVKLSSQNSGVPLLFAKSILEVDTCHILSDKFAFLVWRGGTKSIEKSFKEKVNAIITWGGEDMVRAYQEDLPSKVKLINHGPKISFHLIDKYYADHFLDYDLLVHDIITWEQKACANSQNIFLASDIDKSLFAKNLAGAFERAYPRPELSSDEYVELEKDYALAEYYSFLSGDESIKTNNYQILFDHEPLNSSATNRSVKIKVFKSRQDLVKMLKSFSFYLQTCGLGVDKNAYAKYCQDLIFCGVNRITSVGGMLNSQEGAPHDGSFSLLELTRVCSVEDLTTPKDLLSKLDVPYYENYHNLEEIPFTTGDVFQQYPISSSEKLLNSNLNAGHTFSSGGTTGNPKFIHYAYEEFNYICKLLGRSYLLNGLQKNANIANMFMAGNMWSSFTAVQKALEYCEVNQFPLGGQMDLGEAATIIKKFNIKILFGLPSLIVKLANFAPDLDIKTIFYAGESFHSKAIEHLKTCWGTENFHSAGYACVDIGPIGYQDSSCVDTEHILFDGLKLEVINGEGIISSCIRKNMPVIRYKTGDRIEIISDNYGKIKFKLMGRVDQLINIWSSRFSIQDIEKFLLNKYGIENYQIILNTKKINKILCDTLEIVVEESDQLNQHRLLFELYESLSDLKATHCFDDIKENFSLSSRPFIFAKKTGKLKKIIDNRFLD